jgi:hypothetical protein
MRKILRHYDHSSTLVLTTLDGRGSTRQIRDTIISPDLTAAIPVHHLSAHFTTIPACSPSEIHSVQS